MKTGMEEFIKKLFGEGHEITASTLRQFDALVSFLDKKPLDVIRHRYWRGELTSFKVVAKSLCMTTAQVEKIEIAAFKKFNNSTNVARMKSLRATLG